MAMTKKVSGRTHSKGDFLVAVDPNKTGTWHLPVKIQGKPSRALAGAAWAALHGGFRGNKYAGPDKAGALKRLRALYKSQKWDEPKSEANMTQLENLAQMAAEELERGIEDFIGFVRRAWREAYPLTDISPWSWVVKVFIEHSELGTAVICEKKGELWHVPMSIGDGDAVTFADPDTWKPVILSYTFVSAPASEGDTNDADEQENATQGDLSAANGDLSEGALVETSSGNALLLKEAANGDPLTLDVAIIAPGWGNSRDNNYYSEGMLRECAHVFAGVKMYATDHRPDEKSVRTEVSQILSMVGFTEAGAPIARVGVFDSAFKENVLARNAHGVLSDLHCSILATGKAVDGFELDGRKGKEVVEITAAAAVDWVTKAGAGGHALGIAEKEMEVNSMSDTKVEDKQEDELEEVTIEESVEGEPGQEKEHEAGAGEVLEEMQLVEAARVAEIVAETANLPAVTVGRLVAASYASEELVTAAVQDAVEYIKAITGTGQPPVMQQESAQAVSDEAVAERKSAVNKQYLGSFGGKQK